MRLADHLDRFSPYMLAVLRIVTALIFMEHGTQNEPDVAVLEREEAAF